MVNGNERKDLKDLPTPRGGNYGSDREKRTVDGELRITGRKYVERTAREQSDRSRTNKNQTSDGKIVATKRRDVSVVLTSCSTKRRQTDDVNSITLSHTRTVEIRSSSRLPLASQISVSCRTIDKEHEQEENAAQLEFAEGVVTQTADIFGSNLGGATGHKGATYPT